MCDLSIATGFEDGILVTLNTTAGILYLSNSESKSADNPCGGRPVVLLRCAYEEDGKSTIEFAVVSLECDDPPEQTPLIYDAEVRQLKATLNRNASKLHKVSSSSNYVRIILLVILNTIP